MTTSLKEEISTLEAIKRNMIGFCFRHDVPIIVDRKEGKCIGVWGLHPPVKCDGCFLLREPVKPTSFFSE